MEKLKSLQINFALLAFCLFTVKMMVISATIPDSIITLVLGSLYGYTQYLKRFQPYKLDEAVAKDLLEVKAALSKMSLIGNSQKAAENKKYF